MAVNLLPLVAVAGAGALLMSRKKKKNGKKATCPDQVALSPMTSEEFRQLAKSEFEHRGGDPVNVATVIFKKLVPSPCTKKDYKTTISSGQIGDGFDLEGWNLAKFYAMLVIGVLEVNIDMDDAEGVAHGRRLVDQIATWYSQLTGEPLPDVD